MKPLLPSPLPRFDRSLLRAIERVVPPGEREEWSRTWQAELWHMHHRIRSRHAKSFGDMADFSIGLTRDALWLRTDSWRRTFSGTAVLCLGSLLGLCVLSGVIALVLNGNWHSLVLSVCHQFNRSLFAAPLVVFVTFATASRRSSEQNVASRKFAWLKRQVFLAAKTLLVLTLSFLVSADVCQPIHAALPNTSDFLQVLFFVLLSIVGLRWAFRDQEERCKQCLHSLATPARVGRPSHNLLEWNGTELVCKHGHGLLSVPEMETSWCQSSQWIDLEPGWDQVASA